MNPNWNPSSFGQSKPTTLYHFPILTAEQQLSGLEQNLAALTHQIHGSSARAPQLGSGSDFFRTFLKRLAELQEMSRRYNLGSDHSVRPPLSQHEAARRAPATQTATRGVHIGPRTSSFLVAASQLGQTPVSGGMFLRPVFPNHYNSLRYAVAPINAPARTLEAAPPLVAHEIAMGGGGVQGTSSATIPYNPNRHLAAASEVNLLASLQSGQAQGVKRKRDDEGVEADPKGKRAMGVGPSNAVPDDAVGRGQNGSARYNDGDDDDDLIMVDLDLKLGCP